jgi:hypothetical protein
MDDIYFGYPACTLSIFFYLLQIIILYDFSKHCFKYNNFSPITIFSNYVFTLFWYFFGDIISYKPIKYCNLIGLWSYLFILCIYLIYEYKNKIKVILDAILLITFNITFYHYFTYIVSDPNTNGKYCISISIITFLFKINIIFNMIKNKNYSLISIYSTIISLIMSFLWYKYGEINEDFYIKISFGINGIIDLLTVIIYIIYYKLFNYKKVNSGKIDINEIKKIQINNAVDEEEKEIIKK